tara:strand:- start:167 stop:463 length:297 start_codon:yes stop_codon:yes gene_type:complete
MSFHDEVREGNALAALKAATVSGALWAIALSWATAIREISRLVLPEDTMEAVVAELVAASITTGLGMGIALLVARDWCPTRTPPSATVPRGQLAPARV